MYEETLQKDLQNGYVVKVDPATAKKQHVLIFVIIPFQMKTNPEKSGESPMHSVFFKVNP